MTLHSGFGNASGIVFNAVDSVVDAAVVRDRELKTRPQISNQVGQIGKFIVVGSLLSNPWKIPIGSFRLLI